MSCGQTKRLPRPGQPLPSRPQPAAIASPVLVTGGDGFLGRHLVSRLQTEGAEVRILARPRPGQDPAVPAQVETIRGDIRDPEAVERAVRGVRLVVHLVSNFRSAKSDSQAHSINVVGTENVLDAALRHGVQRLVHCSTIGVHGNVREVPANEETPYNPGDSYQRTKLIAEQRAWQVHAETGLPLTVVRPISIYGPGDRRLLKLFRMVDRGRFVILGRGEVLFHPAYVDDVVEGFVLCASKDEALGEAFIIGGAQYLSLEDLVGRIADGLGVKPPRLHLPLAPFRGTAMLCEWLCAPFGIEPPLHRRRLSFFENDRAFSIEKARSLLKFEPRVSLSEGIRRTIEWYREAEWL